MNRSTTPWTLLLMLAVLLLHAAGVHAGVPPKPADKKLVYDYAGVLGDVHELEDSLEAFAMETSNQITVVTVKSLDGMDIAQYASELGQQWGVGGKKNNNGVVILIKPKNDDGNGQVFISPGYGLEPVLPDALCLEIVNREMIPHFRDNDYMGGVKAAVAIIMPAAKGEFDEKAYVEDDEPPLWFMLLMMGIIVAVVIFAANNMGGGDMGSGSRTYSGAGPIIWGTGLGSGHSGSGWSSGSGWGGGGFGGFGGGSFGGAGAGGSW